MILHESEGDWWNRPPGKVVVYHGGYGCDTGCCGHIVEWDGGEKFTFDHPYSTDDPLEYAKKLVADQYGPEHVKDLDWDHCYISDD